MKMDKTLNLVVPVERADGILIYVHSAPISRQAFDQNFLIVAKAFTAIYAEGLNSIAGPRVAAKLIKKIAEDMGQVAEVESGLFAEMRRLMNVVAPTATGWQTLPLTVALDQKLIDSTDIEEVENAVAFFMLVSAMHNKNNASQINRGATKLWDAQLTSLNSTEFSSSLSTSTKAAVTGPKAPLSSIPS